MYSPLEENQTYGKVFLWFSKTGFDFKFLGQSMLYIIYTILRTTPTHKHTQETSHNLHRLLVMTSPTAKNSNETQILASIGQDTYMLTNLYKQFTR